MKRLAYLGALLLLLLFCSKHFPDENIITTKLLEIIEAQEQAWNEGSIEGFMAYYWNSEDFVFQSGNQRVRGWQALLERYKKNYAGEKMGTLDFTDIEVRVLTENLAYVLGRWQVTRNDTTNQGLFTILFKQLPEGWRIINDHSS